VRIGEGGADNVIAILNAAAWTSHVHTHTGAKQASKHASQHVIAKEVSLATL
jgi:hypothetical protein